MIEFFNYLQFSVFISFILKNFLYGDFFLGIWKLSQIDDPKCSLANSLNKLHVIL